MLYNSPYKIYSGRNTLVVNGGNIKLHDKKMILVILQRKNMEWENMFK